MNGAGPSQRDWYNSIAQRNGGYRKSWSSTIEGELGEDAFRHTLLSLLEPQMKVLDAGCGSGEFSVEMAKRVRHLTGLDFAENMISLARENAQKARVGNCSFVQSSTRDMPFAAESFDLIYSRRGPTSVLLYPHLLRPSGWLLGVHSTGAEKIKERLEASGLVDLRVEEFVAREIIPTLVDFAAYWSRMPGHPDYSDPAHQHELEVLAGKYRTGDQFVVPHLRLLWRGRRTGPRQ